MKESLFITGAGRFIGSRLLGRINASRYETIHCLTRDAKNFLSGLVQSGNIHVVEADLLDVELYRQFIANCDTVVHMAAATGKVDAEKYTDVNVHGTKALIDLCEQENIANFLHLSTIAVRYPDKSYYPYAQTKELAEQIVRSSQLKYTIIRPTIVIGEKGSTWAGFARLAKAPVIPLFGDGTVKIQPIYIDDLITCVESILNQDHFKGETLEIGGPQMVTFEEFFSEIYRAVHDRNPRFLRLPYKPVKGILGGLESSPISISLPISAGQLSAFGNDGTIEENDLYLNQVINMKNVPEMVALVLREDTIASDQALLERECRVYTKYIINQLPNDYVIGKYAQAHEKSPGLDQPPTARFHRTLLDLSVKSPILTKIVDAYSAIFLKNSLFRKKMILLLAILESSPPSYVKFDYPDSTNIFGLFLSLGLQGIFFIISLLLSIVIFVPLQILLKILRK